MKDRRDEFLLEMYKQVSNHLNRHILGNWQFIGVLAGAVGFLTLTDKGILSLDFASAIVIAICAWLIANTLDASNWFNRNINIISNIERQFLNRDDLKEIHPYFDSHRPSGSIISFFKIQLALGVAIAFLILLYHFYKKVLPNWLCFDCTLDFPKFLPYLTALVAFFWCRKLWKKYEEDDISFDTKTPGKLIP